jgi:hypothetical protein
LIVHSGKLGGQMVDTDSLTALRAHPLTCLADWLATYTGVDRNLIQLMEMLSLAGGRMGCPLHLDVRSDDLAADLHLANRILDLGEKAVAKVDSLSCFRKLEQQGLGQLYVVQVLARGGSLFRDITSRLARSSPIGTLPSVWRIDDQADGPPAPGALCLMTIEAERDLCRFGSTYATSGFSPQASEASKNLIDFLKRLSNTPASPCPFNVSHAARLTPENSLILERVLQVFAASRAALSSEAHTGSVSSEDYNAVRALLCELPLTPAARSIPPAAVATAETIFEHATDPAHQLSLPGHSNQGTSWFTREDAKNWTGLSYNTVKKNLRHMEEDGLVQSTVAETNRQRGRTIHFRFVQNCSPPFTIRNPFEVLPTSPEENLPG